MLVVEKVSKAYEGLTALQDVSLTVEAGSITGLIGPNGSGKSTLFEIVSGFQRPDAGRILLRGERIDGLAPHRVAQKGVLRTFQLSEGGQRLTAVENLLAAARGQREHAVGGTLGALPRLLRRERDSLTEAWRILEVLGLTAVANQYLATLSGGQRKLIDLGRAFMARAELCLLDEPTAGVNPSLITVILEALTRMSRELGMSVFVVEHNMRVISEVCDHVYVLDAGSLIAEGTPAAVQSEARVLDTYLGRGRAAAG